METSSFKVRFPETSSAQANRWAGELKEALLDTHPAVKVDQVREHSDTMDLGATLQVLAGSSVLAGVVKALQSWLGKRRDATVELSIGDRKLKLTGVSPEQAIAQAQAFFQQGESSKEP